MKRPFIAGVMGLALAGCAHTRSEVSKVPDGTNPVGPVGLNPVPSLHDTINRGTGSAALAQTALGDPNDPRWSGVAPNPESSRTGATGASIPAQAPQSPRMAATEAAATQPDVSRIPQNPPDALPDRLTAQPSSPSLAGNQPVDSPDRLSAQTSASSVPRNQPADVPDGLNPTPSLDVAASAAAASMPALSAATAAGAPSPGLPPTANPATPPISMTAGTGSVPQTTSPTVPGDPSPAASVPYTLERPGGPMPGMLARPGGPSAPPTGAPADVVGAGGPLQDGPPGSGPNGPNLAGPSANGLEPVGVPPSASPVAAPAPTDAAVSPSVVPAGPTQGAGARKARPAGDPLLGPNPDLMPELPPLPDAGPAAAPAAAKPPATSPSAAPGPSGPPASPADDLPPLGPATGPAGSPPVLDSPDGAAPAASPGPPAGGPSAPPELGPPSADNRPGGTGPTVGAVQVADLPPLEPVPSASELSGGRLRQAAAPAMSSGPARRASTRPDRQILRASLQSPAREAQEPEIPGSWHQASMTAAKVGDEIITIRDLHAAINDLCKRKDIPYNSLPREQKHELCANLMRELINQSLLLQEAKRTIKSPKMYDQFTSEADRFWREDQIPQLEVEFAAENEAQLREKLKEHGRSFDTISLMTRRGWMADAFLHAKLKDKIKVELPELLKYYNEHLRDKQFDRPAQITWREIVVESGPKTTPEEARRKIEAIHESLRRGADFAALAKAQSEGPSRSREQGGLMQTSPGSFGVASVNEALDALPIGQVSSVLEGPSSYHIVRVENRRASGPAPFEELQDEIRSKILEKRFQAERAAYIQKLRDESYVSTFLDEPDSSPGRVSR